MPGAHQTVSLGRIGPPADLLKARNVGIVAYGSVGCRRRRTLGPVPEFQVAQDFFDHGAVADQTDDFERAGAGRANQWGRFVHLLNQPRPRAPDPAPELVGAAAIFVARRQRNRRTIRNASASVSPVHIREGAVVPDGLPSRPPPIAAGIPNPDAPNRW